MLRSDAKIKKGDDETNDEMERATGLNSVDKQTNEKATNTLAKQTSSVATQSDLEHQTVATQTEVDLSSIEQQVFLICFLVCSYLRARQQQIAH